MALVFFFKQKTAYEMRISDWSSDVCSSDLALRGAVQRRFVDDVALDGNLAFLVQILDAAVLQAVAHRLLHIGPCPSQEALSVAQALAAWVHPSVDSRSAERRVGRACVSPCRSRGTPDN